MSSLADETPEGRSIVVLAKGFGIREHDFAGHEPTFVPFTAQTRMSGVDYNGTRLRKGAGSRSTKVGGDGGRSRAPRARAVAGPDRPRGWHAAGGRPQRAQAWCSA